MFLPLSSVCRIERKPKKRKKKKISWTKNEDRRRVIPVVSIVILSHSFRHDGSFPRHNLATRVYPLLYHYYFLCLLLLFPLDFLLSNTLRRYQSLSGHARISCFLSFFSSFFFLLIHVQKEVIYTRKRTLRCLPCTLFLLELANYFDSIYRVKSRMNRTVRNRCGMAHV